MDRIVNAVRQFRRAMMDGIATAQDWIAIMWFLVCVILGLDIGMGPGEKWIAIFLSSIYIAVRMNSLGGNDGKER